MPAGTFITVRVNQPLSSDHNQEGDIFNGSLVQPMVVDGVVVAQRGQTVMGRVAEAVKAGRAQGTSRLGLELTGITLADGLQANVRSQMVSRHGQSDVGRDVGTVATTTAVGAAIGAAADWGRGAAIGAGAGAAAGLVGVLLTRGHPTIVYPESDVKRPSADVVGMLRRTSMTVRLRHRDHVRVRAPLTATTMVTPAATLTVPIMDRGVTLTLISGGPASAS